MAETARATNESARTMAEVAMAKNNKEAAHNRYLGSLIMRIGG